MRHARLNPAHRSGLARHRPRRRPMSLGPSHADEPRTSDLVLAVIGVALLAGLGLVAAAGIAGASLNP